MSRQVIFWIPVLCILVFARWASAGFFVPLGHLRGVDEGSYATDVSADGSVVVGFSASTGIWSFDGGAFRWTRGQGMVGLPDGDFRIATGVSADGSAVVGSFWLTAAGGAFRWTSDGGTISLGDFSGDNSRTPWRVFASGISADGSVVVGQAIDSAGQSKGIRWTRDGGIVELAPGNLAGIQPAAVSADGSVVVGSRRTGQAVRWSSDGGIVGLRDLPGGESRGGATSVSADGSVVVGWSSGADGEEAFRWTSGRGTVGLGDLPGGIRRSFANDVSADGTIVVGSSVSGRDSEAFVWDSTRGMRSVSDMLTGLGVDLTGWTLETATAISADGSTIVGNGFNPSGRPEAWLANITAVPEPSALLTMLAGFLALDACYRLTAIGTRRRKD